MPEHLPVPDNTLFGRGRVLVWFSCCAASAVAAQYAIADYPDERVELLYCDTSASEHPDNLRFLADIEQWLHRPVIRLPHPIYRDIYAVFHAVGYLRGANGAPCTDRLKRYVRKLYQRQEDVHVFGFTADEDRRRVEFEGANHSLRCAWPLIHRKLTRRDCFRVLEKNGIALPAMYRLGYRNNNCIGCVKGGIGYWNKIRVDFPDVYARMAATERAIGFALLRYQGQPCYLDELPPDAGRYTGDEDMSCGPQCVFVNEEVPHA